MLCLLGIHVFISSILGVVLVCTAFHFAPLSCCGRYSEVSLYAYLFVNMTFLLIYYSNFKYSNEYDLHIVKRSKLLLFFLIVGSPLFLLTHVMPGLFCRYSDFMNVRFHHSMTLLILTIGESVASTFYMIKYEKYRLHKEVYSRPSLNTSLKL